MSSEERISLVEKHVCRSFVDFKSAMHFAYASCSRNYFDEDFDEIFKKKSEEMKEIFGEEFFLYLIFLCSRLPISFIEYRQIRFFVLQGSFLNKSRSSFFSRSFRSFRSLFLSTLFFIVTPFPSCVLPSNVPQSSYHVQRKPP